MRSDDLAFRSLNRGYGGRRREFLGQGAHGEIARLDDIAGMHIAGENNDAGIGIRPAEERAHRRAGHEHSGGSPAQRNGPAVAGGAEEISGIINKTHALLDCRTAPSGSQPHEPRLRHGRVDRLVVRLTGKFVVDLRVVNQRHNGAFHAVEGAVVIARTLPQTDAVAVHSEGGHDHGIARKHA